MTEDGGQKNRRLSSGARLAGKSSWQAVGEGGSVLRHPSSVIGLIDMVKDVCVGFAAVGGRQAEDGELFPSSDICGLSSDRRSRL